MRFGILIVALAELAHTQSEKRRPFRRIDRVYVVSQIANRLCAVSQMILAFAQHTVQLRGHLGRQFFVEKVLAGAHHI